ncbi:MAG TPA: hypothetical protein VMU75_08905 [Acidimicrobiales bacterium]|nr:hypothetical protein [Acidimicrobiales bacterium]
MSRLVARHVERGPDRPGEPIAFGAARSLVPRVEQHPDARVVAMAVAPGGNGYWVAAGNGTVLAFGDARSYGSAARIARASPVTSIAATPDARGYWLATRDGRVRAFGDARSYGSASGSERSHPVVAIVAAADGQGYWLALADGAVLAFGDAPSYGSASGERLAAPVVGIAATGDGRGYWLVTADGAVLAFGDARSYGSASGERLAAPVVGIAPSGGGTGYWLASADGGVFSFGGARYHGSAASSVLLNPVTAIAARPGGGGYWLLPTQPAPLASPAQGFLPGRVTAIGDSVMLDAAPDLQADIPGIAVEAAVSRQWDAGVALAQQLRTGRELGASVVIDLGTNGPVDLEQFQHMMGVLAGASRVVFVTVHLPPSYSWAQSVNATLRRGVPMYPVARLVDVNTLADEHPGWFGSDGVHMPIGGAGAQAMAQLIAAALGRRAVISLPCDVPAWSGGPAGASSEPRP